MSSVWEKARGRAIRAPVCFLNSRDVFRRHVLWTVLAPSPAQALVKSMCFVALQEYKSNPDCFHSTSTAAESPGSRLPARGQQRRRGSKAASTGAPPPPHSSCRDSAPSRSTAKTDSEFYPRAFLKLDACLCSQQTNGKQATFARRSEGLASRFCSQRSCETHAVKMCFLFLAGCAPFISPAMDSQSAQSPKTKRAHRRSCRPA